MAIPKELAGLGAGIKRSDMLRVKYEELHAEPGFNRRIHDDAFHAGIIELAEFITMHGIAMLPPLEVRRRDEGGVWIVEGHRRQLAIAYAERELGANLRDNKGDLWIDIKLFVGNDVDRKLRILTSQDNAKLTPVERAQVYKDLINMNLTAADIAKRLKHSTQHVKDVLALANMDHAAQKLVTEGKVSATTAVKVARQSGERATQVLKDAAAAAGDKKVTSKTLAPKWSEPRINVALQVIKFGLTLDLSRDFFEAWVAGDFDKIRATVPHCPEHLLVKVS